MKKASKHSLYSFVSFIENVAPDLPFINDLKSPPYYYFAKKDGGGEREGRKNGIYRKQAGRQPRCLVKSAPANHPIA